MKKIYLPDNLGLKIGEWLCVQQIHYEVFGLDWKSICKVCKTKLVSFLLVHQKLNLKVLNYDISILFWLNKNHCSLISSIFKIKVLSLLEACCDLISGFSLHMKIQITGLLKIWGSNLYSGRPNFFVFIDIWFVKQDSSKQRYAVFMENLQ